MSRPLSYFVDAVRKDLGDQLADSFPEGFFERAVNEGQARYEPELLRRRVILDVELLVDDDTYELPDDAYDVEEFQSESGTSSGDLPNYTIIEGVVYFSGKLSRGWTGRVFYRAHYPEVTDEVDCLLPATAMDGLISFVLYKAFRRIAAGRAEYQTYATIVGNAVSMADLEQAASIHQQDFEESRISATVLPEPVHAYSQE